MLNEFPGPNNIAGGLWVGEGVVTGKASIGGCLQSTPDMFFVYELAETVPAWLAFTGPTAGIVAPGDNFDVPLRVYGVPSRDDTMYVVFNTNDLRRFTLMSVISYESVCGMPERF